LPIYEYKCENGHIFETVQRMIDDPLSECEVCGAPCQRVMHPVAVHFKGKGFYTTDYGAKKKAEVGAESKSDGGEPSADSGKSEKPASDSGSSEKSSSKPD
jgi:putative FmdB family regulatory protein